jgi:aldehyde dehydrogenase (NAD+)
MNVAIGATLAGQAFTIAQVGLVHSMSHTMGVLHHVHHGTACGIFLPLVMRFNVDYAAPKLAMVADALGVSTADMSERDAALAAADEVEALMVSVGHPTKLREIGIQDEDFGMASLHAISDTATLFNARPVTGPQEVAALFHEAY